MSATLDVLEPGLATSVQDLGRPGWMRVGLPQGGALDREALRLATALTAGVEGGPGPAAGGGPAALELRYLGPSLRVRSGALRAALVGAEASMGLHRADGEKLEIGPWRTVSLGAGDVLRVGALREGSTAVLALGAGIETPMALGARATFARAGLGGVQGRSLVAGDRLTLARGPAASGPDLWIPPEARPSDQSGAAIRVVLGPQADHLTDQALKLFMETVWTVGREADRMGLRLDGPPLAHRGEGEILSEGAPEGSIQVPAGGRPILLLADRGATGGYPKIAVTASVDLSRLGRLKTGDTLRFELISPELARKALLEREREIQQAVESIAPFHRSGAIDENALWQGNLITARAPECFDD